VFKRRVPRKQCRERNQEAKEGKTRSENSQQIEADREQANPIPQSTGRQAGINALLPAMALDAGPTADILAVCIFT
jgi:hypothetical protein